MAMSDRVKTIIKENGLKQKEFAKSINVTESYISKLLRDESGLSNSTATLIEELYGYSVEWILNGIEPKMSSKSKSRELTPLQRKIISEVEQMNDVEIAAVKAFIDSLGYYQKIAKFEAESKTDEVIYKCETDIIKTIKSPTKEQLGMDASKIIGTYTGEVEMSKDELGEIIESHFGKNLPDFKLMGKEIK